MHQDFTTSSETGNGSDVGLREAWLPLFDEFQVDLVLCGHDHDYERSFPVRGYDSMAGTEVATGAPVQTYRPHPVSTTDTGTFDTSQGTVHLILGGGGTDANLDEYGVDTKDGLRQAKVFTKPNRPAPTTTAGVYARPGAERGRGRHVVGEAGCRHRVRRGGVRRRPRRAGWPHQHHCHLLPRAGRRPGEPRHRGDGRAHPDYTEFETFTLTRPRADARPGPARPPQPLSPASSPRMGAGFPHIGMRWNQPAPATSQRDRC